MKKQSIVIFILILSLLFTGCSKKQDKKDLQPTPPVTTEPEPEPTPEPEPPEKPEYPVIDGSSSTVGMDAAIRAHLTDLYIRPTHSKTYDALERLIPDSENPADVLLAVKYYDDTIADAEARGAKLVAVPIAKEGFVFIVHKDNPIESLTAEQIRGIYSGEITNWSEVGGEDLKIDAFQRNLDSGSQTAFTDFMGDTEIADIEPEFVITGMGDMLEHIISTGTSAIGFNIYSWSMGQTVAQNDLKFVQVDGIAATDATLADGTYPLIVYTYSYYNEGNERAAAFTDWLLTEEGQDVITSAGYVGIDGKLPPEEPDNFTKDEASAGNAVYEYYEAMPEYSDVSMWVERFITDPEKVAVITDAESDGLLIAAEVTIITDEKREEADVPDEYGKYAYHEYVGLTRAIGDYEGWRVVDTPMNNE